MRHITDLVISISKTLKGDKKIKSSQIREVISLLSDEIFKNQRVLRILEDHGQQRFFKTIRRGYENKNSSKKDC